MRQYITLVALLLVFGITIVGGNPALATTTEYYGGSGGTISGTVISPSGNVVDWSQIHAVSGNQTFEAFTGFSGFYLMRVPAGFYNVSVYDFYNPQFWAPNMNVSVTDGSSNTVNFYLQPQAPSPVPEFQDFSAIAIILTFVMACLLTRRLKLRTRPFTS